MLRYATIDIYKKEQTLRYATIIAGTNGANGADGPKWGNEASYQTSREASETMQDAAMRYAAI